MSIARPLAGPPAGPPVEKGLGRRVKADPRDSTFRADIAFPECQSVFVERTVRLWQGGGMSNQFSTSTDVACAAIHSIAAQPMGTPMLARLGIGSVHAGGQQYDEWAGVHEGTSIRGVAKGLAAVFAIKGYWWITDLQTLIL